MTTKTDDIKLPHSQIPGNDYTARDMQEYAAAVEANRQDHVRGATKMVTVDELAQEIRRVDGTHSMGAGALAEALMPFLQRCAMQMVPSDEELLKVCESAGFLFHYDRYVPGSGYGLQAKAYTLENFRALLSPHSNGQPTACDCDDDLLGCAGVTRHHDGGTPMIIGVTDIHRFADCVRKHYGSSQPTAADGMATLRAALAADPDYAWSWHCAVWAAAHDEGLETGAANRAAARLMRAAFDVDTTKNPNFSPAHL